MACMYRLCNVRESLVTEHGPGVYSLRTKWKQTEGSTLNLSNRNSRLRFPFGVNGLWQNRISVMITLQVYEVEWAIQVYKKKYFAADWNTTFCIVVCEG